ncbi:MAG: hypothetical protein HPY69_04475 [Armatimonadetes bacterium]|nr:hypothetical protein [Armatimonadota bacterium]
MAILAGQPPDRPCWTTLVDDTTRSVMPDEWRNLPLLDFYRRLGCDILQFGSYGLPPDLQVPAPVSHHCPEAVVSHELLPDGTLVQTTRTPWGDLTATFRSGHPLQHPVASADDLRVFTRLWEHSSPTETHGAAEAYGRVDAALGDDGLFLPTMTPSPVQQLLQLDMGVVAFYRFLQDQQQELLTLLDVMQQARCREYEAMAAQVPAPALIAVENTSTRLISPALYRELSLPQIRQYADICHRHGKRLVLHMCGHLRALLPVLSETGADAINALTPPPVGDTTVEMALDALGDEFPQLGSVLQETAFQAPETTRERIWQALDELYTPRVRAAPLLLWAAADGLPTPIERFLVVREWMERQG